MHLSLPYVDLCMVVREQGFSVDLFHNCTPYLERNILTFFVISEIRSYPSQNRLCKIPGV